MLWIQWALDSLFYVIEPLTSEAAAEALINEAVSHLVSVTYDDTDIYVSSINYILMIFLSLNIITITAIKNNLYAYKTGDKNPKY